MDYTTNKNLAKPTENETYDLATVNENMDKIDAALKTNDDAISQLTENMEWVKVGELSGSIIDKSIPMALIGWRTPKEYLVKWRLFPTHPWNYIAINAASLSTTDKQMGSFYFSPTFYASFSFILSGGGLSVESSYTGGKHGSTDLANPENAKIVLYYK